MWYTILEQTMQVGMQRTGCGACLLTLVLYQRLDQSSQMRLHCIAAEESLLFELFVQLLLYTVQDSFYDTL